MKEREDIPLMAKQHHHEELEEEERGEKRREPRRDAEKVLEKEDTKAIHIQTGKDNVTHHQPTLFDWVTYVGGSIDPIPIQWVDCALSVALIISATPCMSNFHLTPTSQLNCAVPKPTVTPFNGDVALCAPTSAMGMPTTPSQTVHHHPAKW
jgi:hypothetical protein